MLLVPAGCGRKAPPPGIRPDTTPPRVVSVTAGERARIEVVFDEPMDIEDLRAPAHFTATAAADSTDTLGLLLSIPTKDGRRAALITLPQDTSNYVMRLSELSDAAGNALAETSLTFAGSREPDETRPAVLEYEPLRDRMNVPQAAPIVVTFDDRMSRHAAEAAFSVEPPVGGAIAWSRHSTVFHFYPSDTFPSDSMIRVSVDESAADLAGNTLGRPVEWSYITAVRVDTAAPWLRETEPDSGAVGVPATSEIVFTFSEAMNTTGSAVAAISPDPDPEGNGLLRWDPSGKVLTYHLGPAEDDTLEAGQTYAVYLPRFGFHDRAGNRLRRDYAIVFSTGEAIDPGECTIQGSIARGEEGGPGSPRADGWVVAYRTREIRGARPAYITPVLPETGRWQIDGALCGTYYLIGVWDSDRDGWIEIEGGDAHGAYGAFDALLPLPLPPEEGGPGAVELRVNDPSAIVGRVFYVGEGYGRINVEAFRDTIWQGEPASWVRGLRTGDRFALDDLTPGSYIVRAYVDLDGDGVLDEGEPNAPYGPPRSVELAAGEDRKDVVIAIGDPPEERHLTGDPDERRSRR